MLFSVMFFQHPASCQWEPLPMARLPGIVLWAWYRPAHLPSGVVVSIPPELLTAFPAGFPMTLGDVLTAAGVPPQQFQAVSLFGCEWHSASQNGTQRAQRTLGKIAGKIRDMRVRNREPLGGTNIDRSVRRKS